MSGTIKKPKWEELQDKIIVGGLAGEIAKWHFKDLADANLSHLAQALEGLLSRCDKITDSPENFRVRHSKEYKAAQEALKRIS